MRPGRVSIRVMVPGTASCVRINVRAGPRGAFSAPARRLGHLLLLRVLRVPGLRRLACIGRVGMAGVAMTTTTVMAAVVALVRRGATVPSVVVLHRVPLPFRVAWLRGAGVIRRGRQCSTRAGL
jgi:hypothetical protein